MTNLEIHDQPSPRRGRFQFSIRSMLILTAVVAVICSVLFAMPGWLAWIILGFTFLTIPGVFISILTYGTPYQKTFAIGAMSPFAFLCLTYHVAFYGLFANGLEDSIARLLVGLLILACAVSGFVTVLVRFWLEGRNRRKPDA
ncbi:MAG: hypothetical protein JW719_02685 [Pirellulales bacterium]|nr:hypothetical protein [Pirellulales bacterium]